MVSDLKPIYRASPRYPYVYYRGRNCPEGGIPQEFPDTIKVFSGSSVSLKVKFPFSLNGNTVSIVQSKPKILMETITIDVVDDNNVTINIPASTTAQLPLSSKNSMRLGVTFADGTQRNYNNLFIEVE